MITQEDDEARLDAIKRWHIFNRNPSDEHWRNIDSLLYQLDRAEGDRDEYHAVNGELIETRERLTKVEKIALALAKRLDGERGEAALLEKFRNL